MSIEGRVAFQNTDLRKESRASGYCLYLGSTNLSLTLVADPATLAKVVDK